MARAGWRRRAVAAVAPLQWLAAQAPGPASEQPSDEAVMYNKGHFKGAGQESSRPDPLHPAVRDEERRHPRGHAVGVLQRQHLHRLPPDQPVGAGNGDERPLGAPVANIIPASATAAQGLRGTGQSLRGLASEYFVAPERGGNRIEVQPGTAEAMSREAIEFCRTHGWRASAHQRLQTVEGRFYLADVFCANE